MNWLIFGDDWGGHPSTTQHLALHLPPGDRIIWVNSIGMRSPDIHLCDLRRLAKKAWSAVRGGTARSTCGVRGRPENLEVIPPLVVPFHRQPLARWFNRSSLHRSIHRAMGKLGIDRFTVLASNPVAIFYLAGLPCDCLCYLRLDDYPRLPGVDAELARVSEARILEQSQALFVTAKTLLPQTVLAGQHQVYLPQGVDLEHFASVPLAPPRSRVLGFYGMLAEWIDYPLIERVAEAMPDWTMELIGPMRSAPERLRQKRNIRILPPVAYEELPRAIRHWDAAWIPFRQNALTRAVNPLKLREYLAAGLPTLCTPLPEVLGLNPTVALATTHEGVGEWLDSQVSADTAQRRQERREAVVADGWEGRARILRDKVEEIRSAPRTRSAAEALGFAGTEPAWLTG